MFDKNSDAVPRPPPGLERRLLPSTSSEKEHMITNNTLRNSTDIDLMSVSGTLTQTTVSQDHHDHQFFERMMASQHNIMNQALHGSSDQSYRTSSSGDNSSTTNHNSSNNLLRQHDHDGNDRDLYQPILATDRNPFLHFDRLLSRDNEANLDPLLCLEEDLELRRLDGIGGFANQHVDLKSAQIQENQEQSRLLQLQVQQLRMEKVLMRGEILEDGMTMGAPPRSISKHGMGINVGYDGDRGSGNDVMDMGLMRVGGLSSDRIGRSGSADAYDHELAILHQQQLAASNNISSSSILSGIRERVVGGMGIGLSPRSVGSISPRSSEGPGQLHNTNSHLPHDAPFHGNTTTSSHTHSALQQHRQAPFVAASTDMDFVHRQQQLLIKEQQQLLLLEQQQLQELQQLKKEQQQKMQQRQQQLLLKQLLLQQQPQPSPHQHRGEDRGEYLGGDRSMGVPGQPGARMGLGVGIGGGDFFDAGSGSMGRHGATGGSIYNPAGPSSHRHHGPIHGNDRGGGEYMGGMGDNHNPSGLGDASLIPIEYLCPMSSTLMFDPVTAADGITYERSSIEGWIKSMKRNGLLFRSPTTDKPLDNVNLIPNQSLRLLISNYRRVHGHSSKPGKPPTASSLSASNSSHVTTSSSFSSRNSPGISPAAMHNPSHAHASHQQYRGQGQGLGQGLGQGFYSSLGAPSASVHGYGSGQGGPMMSRRSPPFQHSSNSSNYSSSSGHGPGLGPMNRGQPNSNNNNNNNNNNNSSTSRGGGSGFTTRMNSEATDHSSDPSSYDYCAHMDGLAVSPQEALSSQLHDNSFHNQNNVTDDDDLKSYMGVPGGLPANHNNRNSQKSVGSNVTPTNTNTSYNNASTSSSPVSFSQTSVGGWSSSSSSSATDVSGMAGGTYTVYNGHALAVQLELERNTAGVEIVHKKVLCPVHRVKHLIGSKGSVVNKIMTRTGAAIVVEAEIIPAFTRVNKSTVDAQIVSIKGTKEGTILAQKLVFAVIDVGARVLDN